MRRALVLLVVALAALLIVPGASPQVPGVPDVPEQVPVVCGTMTGPAYAIGHIVVETPGHIPGEHMGCAGFPF